MSRIAYVNGRYVPHSDAMVHVEDRGYQFADGVYEVVAIANGKMADMAGHLDRLGRSMQELRIDWPISRRAMEQIMRRMVSYNLVKNGGLYIQVTRGVARRDFPFPADAYPSLVMTCAHVPPWKAEVDPVKVITVPDQRWARCDIKTVGLLAPVLSKQAAREVGAFEAWMVDGDGYVTEGTSSNAWIVTKDNKLISRKCTQAILRGITRMSVLDLASDLGLTFEERQFTPDEAYVAKEAFMTSARAFVTPIGEVDGNLIGEGTTGPIAKALRLAYLEHVTKTGS